MATYNHEQAVRELMGMEYNDYILLKTPAHLQGIQAEMTEEIEQTAELVSGQDIFDLLAATELQNGYWEDSEAGDSALDTCAKYNVLTTTDRWFSYTPKTCNTLGCQLNASYAPTAQGRSSWGVKHGDLAKASHAAGLHRDKYHAAQARLKAERAIHGIEEIVKPSRSRARRLARELRADNRRLANILA